MKNVILEVKKLVSEETFEELKNELPIVTGKQIGRAHV